jgi:tetratricopeptide (TPR) repeat protein
MTWAILLAAVVLAAVAAAGMLRPFGRTREVGLERLADPLEDERLGLLRALKDLEEERATGQLTEDAYRALRSETERRAVAVLRALEARDGVADVTADLGELRGAGRSAHGGGNGAARAGSRRAGRWKTLGPALAGGLAVAVLVPVLAHAITHRTGSAPITGTLPTINDPLAFFERRVKEHPDDLAARLDLAQRYLQAGDVRAAIVEYEAALRIDPHDPESLTTLGFLLFRAGRTQDGLGLVRDALAADPRYPEALYDEGLIELQGRCDADGAARAFQAYLGAAPFGSHVQEVKAFLSRPALPSPCPSPTG